MKIYSKRKFIIGGILLLIAIIGIASLIIKGFNLKLLILIPIILMISIFELRNSLSRSFVYRSNIEELDERNQLVSDKSSALSFRIVQYTIFLLKVLFIILFAIFREPTFVWIVLTLSLLIITTILSELWSNLYFEKRL
ncbi:DUF2178 domain-containing protein [Paenibacillus sp. YPG26]|nr:DUF2178 domain-containing protein [Paenibacillus sp. YPG26]